MEEGQMAYEFKTNGAWTVANKYLTCLWDKTDEPSILDIGCYEGLFLNALPSNWHKFGIEPSVKAQAVLDVSGIQVIANYLTDSFSEWHGQFDVVCLFDVFEHLHDPLQGMINALKYLKLGGRLLVSTANADSWTWKWVGTDHWYIDTPLHISFATPKYFKWFCKKTPAALCRIQRICHRVGSYHQKFSDSIVSLYFGARRREGVFRILRKAILSIPSYRYLMHKINMPSAFYIKDHFLVEIQRTVGRIN